VPDYDLGRAEGRIEIDSSGAVSGVNRAQSAVGGFTGTTSKGHPILRAFGTAMVGVGVAAAGVIGTGVKLASDYQQAEIAFTNFLGSAREGKAFLEELQQFAAETPFEFPDLRDAAARLLGAGAAAESVIPLMTTVGDAVAAIGGGSEQIDRATLALVQMQLKGRVTNEELLQLTEAGIPAVQALAEGLGISVAEAQEKVSKKQVDVNELFAILEERAVPALQRTAGMMEQQSKSLAGLFSTLKDEVGASLVEIAQPLVEGLTKAMPELSKTIQRAMKQIGPAFADVLGSILTVISKLLPAVTPVVTALGTLLADALKALLPLIKQLTPVFIELGGFMAQIGQVLGPAFAEVMKLLAPLLVDIFNALKPLLPPLLELITAILPILILFMKLVATQIKIVTAVLSPIIKVIAQLVSWVARVVKAFQDWVKQSPFIKRVAEIVSGVVQSVIGFLRNLWETVKQIWEGIKETTINIWHAIRDFLRPIVQGIKDFILTVWRNLKGAWNSIWNGIKGVFIAIWDNMVGIAEAGVNAIIMAVNAIIRSINAAAEAAANILSLGFADVPDIPTIPHVDFNSGSSAGTGLGSSPVGGGGRRPGGTSGLNVTLDVDGVALTQAVTLTERRNRIKLGRRG
jgi:tape measure domain-containing protein